MLDVFEQAKQMEREGKEFYLDLAQKCSVPEVKGVLNFLAKEEENHEIYFDNLKKNKSVSIAASTSLSNAKIAFTQLAKNFHGAEDLASAKSIYEKAVTLEEQAVATYKGILNSADASQKDALHAIIAEEQSHAKIMQAMVRFVSEPESWLENAEFNRLV